MFEDLNKQFVGLGVTIGAVAALAIGGGAVALYNHFSNAGCSVTTPGASTSIEAALPSEYIFDGKRYLCRPKDGGIMCTLES